MLRFASSVWTIADSSTRWAKWNCAQECSAGPACAGIGKQFPQPARNRPICENRDVLIEVITALAKNEFPLSAPPRWASELFSALAHTVPLEMKSANLSMALPTHLGADCQTCVESVLTNLENDAIRSSRQRSNFRANDGELVVGSADNPLVLPEPDCVGPPCPPAPAALRRPRFWLELPPVGATPKRPRDSASEDSDAMADLPLPKRQPPQHLSLRADILRRLGGSASPAVAPRYST